MEGLLDTGASRAPVWIAIAAILFSALFFYWRKSRQMAARWHRKTRDFGASLLSRERVRQEVLRGRRYIRPFSIIVFGTANPVEEGADHSRIVEQALDKRVRRTDYPLHVEHSKTLVIVCPETDAEGSQTVAERVKAMVGDEFGMVLDYAAASFPEHGVTLDGLLERAEKNLQKT